MKRTLLLILAGIACTLSLNAQSSVETKTVKGRFTKLDISSRFEVTINQSSSQTSEISISSELEPYLVAEISAGKLCLGVDTEKMRKDDSKLYKEYNRRGNDFVMKADVSVGDLEEIEASGASKVESEDNLQFSEVTIDFSGSSKLYFKNVSAEELEISLSGASKVEIDNIKSNKCAIDNSGSSKLVCGLGEVSVLSIDNSGASLIELKEWMGGSIDAAISGASKATVAGEGKSIKVDASGASYFNAKDFAVEIAYVEGSGASKISVNPSESIGVDISGATNLQVPQNVRFSSISTSGAAKINHLLILSDE